ncbi:sulfite exporter TauE/SafE family protein [bacterium M00.F.Ca.ET.141.01.1.1]|uniref:sulfite exporter TauE/SafE family protein n=1 Tax=unclassified Mesorhizobium TaxID=325217 RepID=UPI000FD929CC|nr:MULTISPECIES: sulfite exporter TauE/SafE family protein [unclassified Mesorhizobium]TGR47348.1 sulfite exporter TauE/SafE family protein [bacterium M00.F.Ca.ET.199.01.1.1]TGU36801.1 sulfite exporter TauE/SafE family protein [bacterium M00.F.Ca.ET.156.01.1.1]TGV55653.1 sulfite exporter TauE/SafE family protein [bacterium M00.F.Ca.ET.141.01.1.1]TGV87989.1 sulfite exporter TauE/SafE family protein [Mesorhizobium sp. M00.F.Ca.ET.149.01.1.1]TGR29061.1 sulfite exporter TauE/SafE family protein [M
MLSIGAVAFIGFVFLAAGLVKGVVGMGLPTVAMGLLAAAMPPVEAAALLLIPSLVTNLWQLFTGPSFGGLCKRLWTMMAGVVVGTVTGAGLLTGAHTMIASAGLGAALMLYALVGLAKAGFTTPARHEAWISPLVGVATGLVTGATGVFVIPAVPYLQSLRLDREALIQALGLSFTVSTLALGFGLFRAGALASPTAQLTGSVLALAPALAGMVVGQALRQRMSVETFRTVFFAGLLALGAYLALEAALQG